MTLETKGKIANHIARLGETGTLVSCQSPWEIPFLPAKKPGPSASPEWFFQRDRCALF